MRVTVPPQPIFVIVSMAAEMEVIRLSSQTPQQKPDAKGRHQQYQRQAKLVMLAQQFHEVPLEKGNRLWGRGGICRNQQRGLSLMNCARHSEANFQRSQPLLIPRAKFGSRPVFQLRGCLDLVKNREILGV